MTRGAAARSAGVAVRLDHRPPLALAPLARLLVAHAVPGLERVEGAGTALTRTIPAPAGPAIVTVDLAGAGPVRAVLRLADPSDRAPVVAILRRWLDLGTDPAPIAAALGADPRLAPLVAARPGLRVPGCVDGAETALLTVIGQQVSLAAARTFAGRLVAAFGAPVADGLASFPAAGTLADAGADRIRAATGVTGARSRTLHALAVAVAAGLRLEAGADPVATRAALLDLPGIGPWTADYLAVRVLGDRDAFPSGDLVLRRALGVRTAREAEALAEPWRPWRAYALLHLWTAAAFS